MIKKMFEFKELPTNILGIFNYVWAADSGDLIIVVIDDHWNTVITNTPAATSPTTAALPTLKNQAQQWPETRAIGFFMMFLDIDQVLKDIQNWLCKIQTSDSRICFLVDAIHDSDGRETFEPANCFVDKLSSLYSPPHQIAYLTQAGSGVTGLREGYDIFSKPDEINEVRGGRKQFSPKFMQFFGKKWHEDDIINDAIQFYAKPWETVGKLGCPHSESVGWCHDCLGSVYIFLAVISKAAK